MAAIGPLERDMKNQLKNLERLQKEHGKAVATREKLDTQKRENDTVDKELKLLGDDGVVYKLIGPVLVQQEQEEATENVTKRLEFIVKEISRYEDHIKDLEEQIEVSRRKCMKLQGKLTQAREKQASSKSSS